MIIKEAVYTGSYVDWQVLPKESLTEMAFAGRSNVGKSSLINLLCNKKHLAHTSSQPGKTQTFNFYKIDNKWNLVDLPGYGFAKVSHKLRDEWLQRMMDYFENRKQLKMVFQLIDARIPPQKIDIEFAMALTQLNIPYVVIFTKADRKLKNEIAKNMLAYKNELKEFAKNEPQTFITSVSDRTGHIELLKWMGKLI